MPNLLDILNLANPKIDIAVLDIGAMSEGVNCYDPLVKQGIAKITGIEPDPNCRAVLAHAHPNISYLPYVLGNGKPATFYLTRYPGCSSIYEPDPNIIDRFTSISASSPTGNFSVQSFEPIQTVRLDDIAELTDIDLMKIDVQGAELDILMHASNVLRRALVLQVEVEFVQLYKNQPLFSDIDVFLRSCDFNLHKFIDVSGRSFRPIQTQNIFSPYSQLLWADAIYVSNLFNLEEHSNMALLKMAIILHDIYDSHDLAYCLLAEIDKRQQTDYAVKFYQALCSTPDLKYKFMNIKDYM